MRDAIDMATEELAVNNGLLIKSKDILSIIVSSSKPEFVIGFNKPLMSYQAGSTTSSSSYSQRLLGYLVDMDGYIDFPILGKIKAEGLTREQLAELITKKLIESDQVGDPIVTIEYMNFKISVLGEVRTPGLFYLTDDRITILEAISRAGDMTIYGRRDNVLVRREQNGTVSFYRIDLRSSKLHQSPAFYLQQNDVVYVEPNNVVSARSRINENRTVNVWISGASLLSSIASLVILFIK